MNKKTIETTDYDVCADCYSYAQMGDATMFDGAYCEPEATRREKVCSDGIDAIVADHVGEGETPGHFSSPNDPEIGILRWPCECCGEGKQGDRYRLTYVMIRG